jgi:hypothetical protein
MTTTDGLKWEGHAVVAQYDPDTIRFIASKTGLDVNVIGDADHPLSMFDRYLSGPDRVVDAGHNLLTTVGLARITSLITGGGLQAMTNAQALAGVGDTNTGAVAGNTDLAAATGSTHRYVMGVDATYPTVANGLITAYATFTAANGNFAWAEWALGIATGAITPGTGSWTSVAATSAVMLNRAVAALGTKVSPAVWTLQSTITLS